MSRPEHVSRAGNIRGGEGASFGGLSFELPGVGRVLFTERAHGNMSSVSGQRKEHASRARERLRAQIGVRRLVCGRQVHGAVVARVPRGPGEPTSALVIEQEPTGQLDAEQELARQQAAEQGPNEQRPNEQERILTADGQITELPGVGVMVLAGDCLPVALGRVPGARGPARRARGPARGATGADQGAVAMLHAGWRGLVAGVLEQGVRALGPPVGGRGIVAIVGPGARGCCYEVGEEVHAALGGAHRHGRRIELAAIARDRLLAAGVAEVKVLDACTICDERFFSHRREGARAGRQAGVAWLG